MSTFTGFLLFIGSVHLTVMIASLIYSVAKGD
jgi:hypothetical protein